MGVKSRKIKELNVIVKCEVKRYNKNEVANMTILEKIKNRVIDMAGLEELSGNPNDERYTFINDEKVIQEQELQEYRVWYQGKSDELLNYYTNRDLSGNAREPIYNRNKPNYFWGITARGEEQPQKKVHSGVPRAIVDTLSNAIGMPTITSEKHQEEIDKILRVNNFTQKLTQEARPLTFVEGWGAWKVNFSKKYMTEPIFQYYEGKDCQIVNVCGRTIGIIYIDYYKIAKNDYVLFEVRRVDNENSYIEYELYRLMKNNEVIQVPLSEVKVLEGLTNVVIPGITKLLGVPSRYFYDIDNKNGGRSIFAGKLDIFDDIDQCLSQASQTDKVSTPVEYYPVDLLERDAYGNTKLPTVYNRQFIKKEVMPNGDGESGSDIQTTQPQLNFAQYQDRYIHLINASLIGTLSPASMGFDVSKKDNALAQREKEKITLYNRNNVMDSETQQLKDLIYIGLLMKEYTLTGAITIDAENDISVKYCEFASPTFETMSAVLTPMFSTGAISTRQFVEKLWGDSLSDEEKEQEIAELEKNKNKDDLQLGDFGLDDDKRTINAGNNSEEEI